MVIASQFQTRRLALIEKQRTFGLTREEALEPERLQEAVAKACEPDDLARLERLSGLAGQACASLAHSDKKGTGR